MDLSSKYEEEIREIVKFQEYTDTETQENVEHPQSFKDKQMSK